MITLKQVIDYFEEEEIFVPLDPDEEIDENNICNEASLESRISLMYQKVGAIVAGRAAPNYEAEIMKELDEEFSPEAKEKLFYFAKKRNHKLSKDTNITDETIKRTEESFTVKFLDILALTICIAAFIGPLLVLAMFGAKVALLTYIFLIVAWPILMPTSCMNGGLIYSLIYTYFFIGAITNSVLVLF